MLAVRLAAKISPGNIIQDLSCRKFFTNIRLFPITQVDAAAFLNVRNRSDSFVLYSYEVIALLLTNSPNILEIHSYHC